MKKLKYTENILRLIDKTIEEKHKEFKKFYTSGVSFCCTGYAAGYIEALINLKKLLEQE